MREAGNLMVYTYVHAQYVADIAVLNLLEFFLAVERPAVVVYTKRVHGCVESKEERDALICFVFY